MPSPKGNSKVRQLLFITPQLPFPPEQGTALRNYNLLRIASRLVDISLVSFASPGERVPAELADICRAVYLVNSPAQRTKGQRLRTLLSGQADMAERLRSSAFNAMLSEVLRKQRYDALQVEGIEMAPFALALPRELQLPFIFDAHNAEWLLQQRSAQADWQSVQRWPAAVYSTFQWRRLQCLERRVCREAKVVLACSQADADALHQLDTSIHPRVLPNGVDTQRCLPGQPGQALKHPTLVFTGKMDYRPNIDAAIWFISEVWPLIKSQNPQAQVYFVGKNPTQAVQALGNQPNVTITGYVPDIRPYLAAADCYIAPLRVGGGTRLKLLEAMACGLPIVSTSRGAEGLEVESGKHLLLVRSAEAFAAAVQQVLANHDLAIALGAHARELACERYDWNVLMPNLEKAYQVLNSAVG